MKKYIDFPTTRYQGSKRKLLPWLNDIFRKIKFESCLDLFGGTSAVSYLLKTLGKKVTVNDFLESNCVAARALIQNNNTELSTEELELLFRGKKRKGTISDNFSGIFFTDTENAEIDTLIHRIKYDENLQIKDFKKDIALFCLFQALLMKRPFNLFHRANLNLRTNDVIRNFGNKTTWEKSITELMRKTIKEVNNAIFDNGKKHTVVNKDALSIKSGYDMIYLDPPYYTVAKHRNIDYLDFYHFLEGLCIYDNWKDNIDFSKKHLPLKKRKSSFKKETFINDLKVLLDIHKESIIAMSYKSPGYPTIKELKKTIKRTHKKIKIHSIEHTYSLNKNNGHYKENLIIGFPRN